MRCFLALFWIASLGTPAWAIEARATREFAFVAPSDCLRQSSELAERWNDAVSLFDAQDFVAARRVFQLCSAECPSDSAPIHMIALCAWAQNERPQAARFLARALRKTQPQPASAFAMAALEMNGDDDAVAVGWLRRGLREVSAPERAYWLSRTVFEPLWQKASPAWVELLNEFSVSTNRAEVRALARQPPRFDLQPAVQEKSDSPLRLSPFEPGLSAEEQVLRVQQQIDDRLISRIRAEDGTTLRLDLPPEAEKEPQEP